MMSALSGLDIALWDLKGEFLGLWCRELPAWEHRADGRGQLGDLACRYISSWAASCATSSRSTPGSGETALQTSKPLRE